MAKRAASPVSLVSLRLSDAELAQIDRAASNDGISRNEWIRRMCAGRSEDQHLDRRRSRKAVEIALRQILLQRCLLESYVFQVLPEPVAVRMVNDAKLATAKFLNEVGLGERSAKRAEPTA